MAVLAPSAEALTYQEELVALFAGELDEGEWLSMPSYRIDLAVELCRVVRPGTAAGLRKAVYGTERPIDAIPAVAVEILTAGWEQWKRSSRS